ncbi:MAG: hypothetical protein ACYTGQ_01920 [Planctomycetota bacterium]|jgi:hypothetical protein
MATIKIAMLTTVAALMMCGSTTTQASERFDPVLLAYSEYRQRILDIIGDCETDRAELIALIEEFKNSDLPPRQRTALIRMKVSEVARKIRNNCGLTVEKVLLICEELRIILLEMGVDPTSDIFVQLDEFCEAVIEQLENGTELDVRALIRILRD